MPRPTIGSWPRPRRRSSSTGSTAPSARRRASWRRDRDLSAGRRARRRRVPAGPAHQRHRGARARAGLLRGAARPQGPPRLGHAGPSPRERRPLARPRARRRARRSCKHLRTYSIGREVQIDDVTDRWTIVSLIGPRAAELTGFEGLGPEHAQRFRQWDGVDVLAVATDLGIDLIAQGRATPRRSTRSLDAAGRRARQRGGRRDRPGRVRQAAASALDMSSEHDAGRGRHRRARGRLREGLLHRPGAGGAPALQGQAEPDAARAAPERARRARRRRCCLGEKEVGAIGTACVSPAHGPIALAIVRREAAEGEQLAVGDGEATAEVVELPFTA